jgi:hypothetical protein
VLKIANEDLTRLQAAWAASFSERDGEQGDDRRSHLLAVGLPRPAAAPAVGRRVAQLSLRSQADDSSLAHIPNFDPSAGMRMMESIVGKRRQWHAFAGSQDGQPAPRDSNSFNFVGR